MKAVVFYLRDITTGKMVLWCYLIWYLVMVSFYFVPTPRIWLSSLGISLFIGLSLVLNIASGSTKPDRWLLFRLFLTPFCVSSFSTLIKDRGFVLIFSPKPAETGTALALCAGFVMTVMLLRYAVRPSPLPLGEPE